MPANLTHTACTAYRVAFQQFAIVDRVGTSIEVISNLLGTTHRPTGQRGFPMHYRSGSDGLIADAFRLSNFST